MTVKELKEELKDLDDELNVRLIITKISSHDLDSGNCAFGNASEALPAGNILYIKAVFDAAR